MVDIKEMLRRRAAGQSARHVARETGFDRKTVGRYFEAAATLPLPPDREPTDEEIHAIAQRVQARPVPDASEEWKGIGAHRARIEAWLAQPRPLKLTKIHTLLKRDHGVSASYDTLRRFAMEELAWRKKTPTVRVADTEPGEVAQIDFGLMGKLFDPATQRVRNLWVLVVTLAYSRYQFVWPSFEQTTAAVCAGLDAAWRFFGAMARVILPDYVARHVIRDRRRRHPTEGAERFLVQPQPCLSLLVEHDLREQMPAVAEHHHEHPRPAQALGLRVPQPPRVPEVDLRDVPGIGLHDEGDVLRPDPLLPLERRDHALDRGAAAAEVALFEPQPVVDRCRLEPFLHHARRDVRSPPLHARLLLRRHLRRHVLLYRFLQLLERGDLLRAPFEQPSLRQRRAIPPLDVGPIPSSHATSRQSSPLRCRRTSSCSLCISVLLALIPASLKPGTMPGRIGLGRTCFNAV
ncbi:hypothetical protein [Sorangium sp. So ce315]|uniref:hypothetical protein n=1 Tax=Sorangium sp. So ce315 TaxID=3133299 RepID=UPI003F63131B